MGRWLFETERLACRPKVLADASALEEVHGARSRDLVVAHMEHERVHGYSMWTLAERGTGWVVGDVGFLAYEGGVEVGWHLRPDARGRGYATEAARGALASGFEHHAFPWVAAFVELENAPSLRVVEKLGMHLVEAHPGGTPPWAEYRLERPDRVEPGWQSRGGVTERLIFGSRDEGVIEAAIDAFCVSRLGAGVADVLFRATSVGVVHGARLADGRRVVVKAFHPRESTQTLEAVRDVQAHLHREGFPCPAPLTGPYPLVNGLATAEALVDDGAFRDTHEPACRRLMAESLAWHLELTRGCGQPVALGGGWGAYAPGRLWPREADTPTVDLQATAAGAEWIDAIAAEAKARARALPPPSGGLVVGHHDWSGKHFRFGEDGVTVVYDWDSVRLGREAVVVGNAAMTFTANFDIPGLDPAPTPEEVRAFVDEYSAARSAPLTAADREHVAACATFIAAYTARCEHAQRGGATDAANGFGRALRAHGADYLRP